MTACISRISNNTHEFLKKCGLEKGYQTVNTNISRYGQAAVKTVLDTAIKVNNWVNKKFPQLYPLLVSIGTALIGMKLAETGIALIGASVMGTLGGAALATAGLAITLLALSNAAINTADAIAACRR